VTHQLEHLSDVVEFVDDAVVVDGFVLVDGLVAAARAEHAVDQLGQGELRIIRERVEEVLDG
jgi:hypothetical protein